MYSTAGVLSAISRLELLVVPLAQPRVTLPRFIASRFGAFTEAVVLPNGLRLVRATSGLVLLPPERARRSTSTNVRTKDAADLIATATSLRTARALLHGERALNLSGVDLNDAGVLGLGGLIPPPIVIRPIRLRPRPPRPDETAIEAPFRLLISPSKLEGFTHAIEPRVIAPDPNRVDDPERVELWHSRLGVRRVDANGVVSIDEAADPQKAIRAVWTRDDDQPAPGVVPFLASLTGPQREALVRQSADPRIALPEPVTVDRLYLTALGSCWSCTVAGTRSHTRHSTTSPPSKRGITKQRAGEISTCASSSRTTCSRLATSAAW